MATARKIFQYIGMAFSVLLVGIIFIECSSLQTKYDKLNTEYKNLNAEYKNLKKEKINPTKDAIDSLIKMEKEPIQNQLNTHEENTLKVFDQLFIDEEDYPILYSSKGVTSETKIVFGEGIIYIVYFKKGGTVMGTNSNRDTWTFTSPRGATVHLNGNNRVTEVSGIVYKSRY